ncbi:hypothetical protein MSP8887_02920 [Marinomonas spartinae]|uniref:Lipoprotein n=1 Tax=Marinomonas spartinae TaxID=1792290 RepID=A0A1A8TSZ4_9GAMM|nr:hypothetical protein [Marinomonas spartinae]SBS37435.1 hypothetical protein MSP8887_02920 [Marinomonas spartinae]SBS37470.1 hypothetical protein MSP8886_04128 [Marinomonas spartinae]
MKKYILLVIAITQLTACAALKNKLTTEQTLQQKAAYSLGVNPENIVISNKETDDKTVRFTASIKDKTYACAYQSTLTIQTDAICQLK